jgi:general secretion pathway protein K
LVLVLWLIVLLSALVGAFALTSRVGGMQGSVLRSTAQLQESARAGLEYAAWRMQLPPEGRWQADGRAYRWNHAGVPMEIRIVDESGKVDLNAADATLLANLLRALGVEPGRDQRLAAAIVDWRDRDSLSSVGGGAEDQDYAAAGLPYGAKDAPFEGLGELRLVLGVDAALYRQLLPNVTVYSEQARPQAAFAPAAVLTAMGEDSAVWQARRQGADGLSPAQPLANGTGTYSIESRASAGQGREVVLRAVLRTGLTTFPASAYTVLRWEEGTAGQ